MARRCWVTGKGTAMGNKVSHAHNKTRRRFLVNIRYKRIWVPSEERWVRVRMCSSGLRTIDKKGADAVVGKLRAAGRV